MAIRLAGSSGALAEVEANSLALRVTPKPIDWGALGIYAQGAVSGVMAANLAANSPIFSYRWGDATRFSVLKKVRISAGNTSTAFSAGTIIFNMYLARSFSVADTGGTSVTPTGNSNKLRTSMGTTLVSDVRISSTATLTAGTRTKDGQPLGSIVVSIPATAGFPLLAPTDLFLAAAGDYPVVFAQNEGFVIEASVPATGTWSFAVSYVAEELTAYVP